MSDATIAHCNHCGAETNHDVLASHAITDRGDELGYGYRSHFEMLQCRGCNSVSMYQKTFLSDEPDDFFVIQFPPAIARSLPDWVTRADPENKIPNAVVDLMYEVYAAIQSNLLRIAAMGIRAVLEMVMMDKVGDKGSFGKNVDAFHAGGFLSSRGRQVLDGVLEAGHASIHRGWEPKIDEIWSLIDITEGVIESVYLHEVRMKNLETGVPRRKPKQPGSFNQRS